MFEEMIATAEEFYQSLGIPYHIVNIVSGRGLLIFSASLSCLLQMPPHQLSRHTKRKPIIQLTPAFVKIITPLSLGDRM
jgi:hypothetical protein